MTHRMNNLNLKRNSINLLLGFVLFISINHNTHAQVSFGKSELINDSWCFTLNNPENAQESEFNHDNWRVLDLPHDWSIEAPLSPTLSSCTGYLPGGIAWYRKVLDLSSLHLEQKAFLYFEGVYNRSEVYVNGHLLGNRPNGYISFCYDITPFINRSRDNVIAVKVDHSREADSRWYTGSGIYRDVYLITSGKVHFDQWGVRYTTPEVSTKKASLEVIMDVKNESAQGKNLTLVNVLLDAEGKKVAHSSESLMAAAGALQQGSAMLKVKNPNLWDLDHPYLYTLQTRIESDGKILDNTETKVGIRSIRFDANTGFYLNEKNMKIKGVCIHHDAGCLGSAVPKEVWKRRLQTLKGLGCNAIRMSHNPQAPDVYNICDEIGLLVKDEAFDEWEFPKRKWLKGWNKGKPGYEGSYDFFEEWSSRDAADMVRRDRNHPSIIMWSIGNEVDYPNDPYSHAVLDHGKIKQKVYGGYLPDAPQAERLGEIAIRLSSEVRMHDASRPVTGALAGVIMSNHTEYPGALDVCGYNYTENRYDEDHQLYPKRVIYGSENGHTMSAWNDVMSRDFISGQFLWTGIDYLGESGRWPARGGNGGLLNYAGFVKPRGEFRRALWSNKPVAYVGTTKHKGKVKNLIRQAWPLWNYEQGEQVKVLGFTNSPKAKLLLNGQQVGETKYYDKETGVFFWDVPFESGQLELIALDDKGDEMTRSTIATSKRSHAIVALSDKNQIASNRGIAQIEISIVDEDGVPVIIADDEIMCKIKGPAKLLGLEAGNDQDMSNYRDSKHRVHKGKMIAYIQATGEKGELVVEFTSPWLIDAKCIINVQ